MKQLEMSAVLCLYSSDASLGYNENIFTMCLQIKDDHSWEDDLACINFLHVDFFVFLVIPGNQVMLTY
jgi:hypothetical protein